MRESILHELKTISPYFQDVKLGVKTFEIRKNDRFFQIGDLLRLKEYNPITNTYSKDFIDVRIIYITRYAQKDGYVVLGIERVEVD